VIDFEAGFDQRKQIEAAAFLICMFVFLFLAGFAGVVVMVYRWIHGV
jgi:hypothetical protein